MDLTLGPPLTAAQVVATQALTIKPPGATLVGRFVRLEPFDAAAHLDALYAASCGGAWHGHPPYRWDEDLWHYLLSPGLTGGAPMLSVPPGEPLPRAAFEAHQAARSHAPDRRMFTVLLLDPAGGGPATVVGQVGLINCRPRDLAVEVGMVAMTPAVQGTPVTSEAVALLLRHVFAAGFERVEWKTNIYNERSKAAALRLGFVHEGVFRRHMVVMDGRDRSFARDTWWSAMLREEWDDGEGGGAEAALERWLSSDAPRALFARRAAQLEALRAAAAAAD